MKVRIAIWAAVGAMVVVFWTLYLSVTSATPRGIALALAHITCPISLSRHTPLNVYFVGLVNAGTYAVAGTVVEIMRRHYGHPNVA